MLSYEEGCCASLAAALPETMSRDRMQLKKQTDRASIAAAAERVRNEFGRLDLLVQNAAISNTRMGSLSLQEYAEISTYRYQSSERTPDSFSTLAGAGIRKGHLTAPDRGHWLQNSLLLSVIHSRNRRVEAESTTSRSIHAAHPRIGQGLR
jgi:NAD(P)-dependent dehydrogenase (short-subunit alcohol dehydrogenase family)